MGQSIRAILSVPGPLRAAYREAAVRHNRLSLLIINLMILGMELFNMLRVLLWSASGLGTWNNRVYFAFYAALCAAAGNALEHCSGATETPAIRAILDGHGALASLMTGSGAAVFGIFGEQAGAEAAAEALRAQYKQVYLAQPDRGGARVLA